MNSILPSIMQSIHPFHCENIAVGRKGYEVRKTKPNIPTPFKAYIYETKGKKSLAYYNSRVRIWDYSTVGLGAVIGEYICDEIQEWVFDNETNSYDISDDDLVLTCLTQEQLWEYGKGKTLYGYHITNLKIYDEPKELSRFYLSGAKCKYNNNGKCSYKYHCFRAGEKERCGSPLTRPPQSWCYCEEV